MLPSEVASVNARERVCRAIEFKGPDRVPTCYYSQPWRGDVLPLVALPSRDWMPPEPYYPYGFILELMALGLWRPKRRLPRGWQKTRHQAMDEWGCLWEVDGSATYLGQLRRGPLEESWDLLERYQPPDMRDPTRYPLFGLIKKLAGAGRYRLVCGDTFIFSRLLFLRGFDQAMTDLVLYPEKVDRLLDLLEDHFRGFIEMVGRFGVDGIQFDDDLGTQLNAMISPDMFRRFFLPRYTRLVQLVHELGMHFILHSCGNIGKMIPLLIEAGIDALQLDSPNQTGLDRLAELGGGKIAFFNVVDIQQVLPQGSPEEIEAYVVEMIEKLGCYNGGLVAATYPTLYSIGATRQQEKIMFNAYKKHGKYKR